MSYVLGPKAVLFLASIFGDVTLNTRFSDWYDMINVFSLIWSGLFPGISPLSCTRWGSSKYSIFAKCHLLVSVLHHCRRMHSARCCFVTSSANFVLYLLLTPSNFDPDGGFFSFKSHSYYAALGLAFKVRICF